MMDYTSKSLHNILQLAMQSEIEYQDATIDQVIKFVNLSASDDISGSIWVRIDERKVRVMYIARVVFSPYVYHLAQSVIFVDYLHGIPRKFEKLGPVVMFNVPISDGGVENATRKAWAQFVEKSER